MWEQPLKIVSNVPQALSLQVVQCKNVQIKIVRQALSLSFLAIVLIPKIVSHVTLDSGQQE